MSLVQTGAEPVDDIFERERGGKGMSTVLETLNVGAVSYLNSRPLIEGLAGSLPHARLSLDFPSRLADQLADGALSVALIPSVEYFRTPGYCIVSDACVAARGPVLSVKLYCRCHPGEIRSLALDEGSRTSAALARVILAERFGVCPETRPLPMTHSVAQSDADAVLLIGDRAMHDPDGRFVEVLDLGEFWNDWTGLPFVFAMWVARSAADADEVAESLEAARDRGVEAIPEIAEREASGLKLSVRTAEQYLSGNLHFRLTSAEKAGLRLFRDLAAGYDLVNPDVSLCFHRRGDS